MVLTSLFYELGDEGLEADVGFDVGVMEVIGYVVQFRSPWCVA